MISMKKNATATVLQVIILVLCAVMCAGSKLVFHACGAKDDGSFMTCHWAEQALFGIGCALAASAVIMLIVRRPKTKSGVALGMIPVSAVYALVPGRLINLCMMTDMRCHSVMKPAAMILGILLAVICAVYAFVTRNDD